MNVLKKATDALSALKVFTLLLGLVLVPTLAFAQAKNITIWPTDQLATIGYGSQQTVTEGSTLNIDASLSSSFAVTLAGTGRTVTLSNGRDGQVITFYVTQDATGSRTITTWTSGFWAGGTEPTLTATAGALDIFSARYNATAGKWYWATVGLDFKQ